MTHWLKIFHFLKNDHLIVLTPMYFFMLSDESPKRSLLK